MCLRNILILQNRKIVKRINTCYKEKAVMSQCIDVTSTSHNPSFSFRTPLTFIEIQPHKNWQTFLYISIIYEYPRGSNERPPFGNILMNFSISQSCLYVTSITGSNFCYQIWCIVLIVLIRSVLRSKLFLKNSLKMQSIWDFNYSEFRIWGKNKFFQKEEKRTNFMVESGDIKRSRK